MTHTFHPKNIYSRDFRIRRPLIIDDYAYFKIVDGLFASIGYDVNLQPRKQETLGVSLLTQRQLTRADEKSKRLRNCSNFSLRSALLESLPETSTAPVEAKVVKAYTYTPENYRTYLGFELEAAEVSQERSMLGKKLMELSGADAHVDINPIHVTIGAAADSKRLEDNLDRVSTLVGKSVLLSPIDTARI